MADAKAQINFNAPAELRKWPSLNGGRNNDAAFPGTYLVVEGTLDECIRQFISRPGSQRHLYEIQTAPQADLITAVMTAEQVVQLARLREFL
jgi:hypothetical protein